ncbi:MAG: hypothetical protein U0U69_11595 [Acidimicrobiia bacterium]
MGEPTAASLVAELNRFEDRWRAADEYDRTQLNFWDVVAAHPAYDVERTEAELGDDMESAWTTDGHRIDYDQPTGRWYATQVPS